MGKRHRQDPALPLEKPVPVRLKDDERDYKQHLLTTKIQARRAVKREASGKARDYRAELDRLEGEIDQLADALQADEELRKQGELFVSPDAAKGTLGEVAAVVEPTAPPFDFGENEPTPPGEDGAEPAPVGA